MNRALVCCAVVAVAAASACAGAISDADFFSSVTHTLIDFQTYGDGSPVTVNPSTHMATLWYDEYTALGVDFDRDLSYVDDQGVDFDAAQAIGGSLDIAIPNPSEDTFSITFSVPVKAFGFWVVTNNTYITRPSFTARNSSGTVIEIVTLEDDLVDGTIGVADYGFMGIWATENIASVDVSKDSAIFDEFRFGVPEPTTMLVLALGGALLGARRRRAA